MLKYAVHPDYIRSRTDQQMHFITAKELMHLYGADPQECLVIQSSTPQGLEALEARAKAMDLIHLQPRYDGDYVLPKFTVIQLDPSKFPRAWPFPASEIEAIQASSDEATRKEMQIRNLHEK